MSSVNFEIVSRTTPELREAAENMRQWVDAHENVRFLDPVALAKGLGSRVAVDKMVRVLAQLAKTGQVTVKYGVLLPDGDFAEEHYNNPEDIPLVVFDSAFEPVTVKEQNIVPIYLFQEG